MNSQHSTVVTADDDERPSMAVIDLVARATGVDPIELDPLYNAIDPEVLDTLSACSTGFTSLTFEYAGRTVVVEGVDDGLEISLEPVTIGTTGSSGIADSGPSA